MRNTLKLGIGMGTAAIVATMSAGVAMATTGGQATGSVAAVSMVNKHITRAEARKIAMAKVPHSRVIEVESDDVHDRAVWKVTLATPHGRVVVDVDVRTGRATIVRRGGGQDLAVTATVFTGQRSAAGDDRGASDDRGAGSVADDHGRDARDHDGAGEERGERHDRGERHGGDGGERHGHDRGGDDSSGR
jgi:Peptidase propeptide and YPEB domain